jgi:hypothetical protein
LAAAGEVAMKTGRGEVIGAVGKIDFDFRAQNRGGKRKKANPKETSHWQQITENPAADKQLWVAAISEPPHQVRQLPLEK